MSYQGRFRVWRGDPSGGALQDFTVEVNEGEVVLDVIHRLQATQAPDLAVRWNCKAGKCGSCSAEVNGYPRLMCMTRMSTFQPTDVVTVTPMRTFPVLRDLVTDVSYNYVKAREIPSFAPPADLAPGDYRMAQVDVGRSQEFRKCIECFLCQDVCHVIRDHEDNKPVYAGPRFLMRIAELDMHPLDTLDRRALAQDQHGLGYCNITKCCTEVCPEGIKITDNALIPLKERVADRRYDPLMRIVASFGRRHTPTAHVDAHEGDAAAEETAARQRLALRSDDRQALARLTDALVRQGRYADAIAPSRRLADVGDRSYGGGVAELEAHARVLMLAVEADQVALSDVEGELDRTLARAQRLAGSGTTLAGAHALQSLVEGRWDTAEREAREVLAWRSGPRERGDALLTLAWALEATGRSAEATAAWGQAQALWPGNPRLRHAALPSTSAEAPAPQPGPPAAEERQSTPA